MIEMVATNLPSKTYSETAFETYLRERGINDFMFECPVEGKRKRPDYSIPWEGETVYLDVKERSGRNIQDGAYHYDPYKSVRSKIQEARRKFKEYKGSCCALVVFNCGDPNMVLDPRFIFGSMLGDLGFTWTTHGTKTKHQDVYLRQGGLMVDHAEKTYKNTTISAVIALQEVRLHNYEFEKAVDEECVLRGAKRGRDSALINIELFRKLEPQWDQFCRVIVCDNPGAVVPFPTRLFRGPLDERWAIVGGRLERIYKGRRCREILK